MRAFMTISSNEEPKIHFVAVDSTLCCTFCTTFISVMRGTGTNRLVYIQSHRHANSQSLRLISTDFVSASYTNRLSGLYTITQTCKELVTEADCH